MSRDLQIPLVLWISTAVVVHFVAGGGAVGATVVEEDRARQRADIRAMVREVRRELGTVEVDIPDLSEQSPPKDPEPAMTGLVELFKKLPLVDNVVDPDLLDPNAVPVPDPDAKKAEEEEKQKKEEELPKPEAPPEKKVEPEAKIEPEKEKAPAEKPQELVILKDNRIAVKQVVKENQQDNPDAPRIADHANHVEEETQARIRSTDQMSADPSPGSNMRGPSDAVGNSDREKTAQAEDKAGDEKKAPGENAEKSTSSVHAQPPPKEPATTNEKSGNASTGAGARGGPGNESQASPSSIGAPGGEGPRAPDAVGGDTGGWSLNPANPGGDGLSRAPGNRRPSVAGSRSVQQTMGLGAGGGASGIANLDWKGFVAAVSEEKLEAERQAAGRSIRSQHRGRYDTNKFERWLPDIENYDPSVKVGNQTALNAAQVPFAGYLTTMHNRIHPIFAEEFLGMIEHMPKGHVLNQDLVTHVEIILSRDEGKILRMGITRNSGVTMFDAAALDSIERASPYGKAPDIIASADGNVYLHWEFHRDPVDACTTRNARPFLVKDPKPLKSNIPVRPAKPGKPRSSDDVPNGPLLPLRR